MVFVFCCIKIHLSDGIPINGLYVRIIPTHALHLVAVLFFNLNVHVTFYNNLCAARSNLTVPINDNNTIKVINIFLVPYLNKLLLTSL